MKETGVHPVLSPVAVVNAGEELLRRAETVSHDIQERVWRAMRMHGLAPPHAAAPAEGRRKSLLLVEDDALSRHAFTLALQREGFAVRGAADGSQALECLEGGPPPDCIVLDLRMPGMDGGQFRQRQRRDARWADVPVVVVSADPQVEAEAESLGAVACLRKPVEPDALLRAVRRHC